MMLFYVFVGLFVSVSGQASFANLEVVSDLSPQDCLRKELDYVQADAKYGLPQCTANWGKGKCNLYYNTKKYKDIIYKPACNKDGTFAAVQCKGERTTGRCFCFDENANRLFGQQWWSQAGNMTCACSKRKAEMSVTTSENYVFFNSLHCNSMGNYEALQCDTVSEQCWCADEQTGDLKSPVVPQAAMTKLPCYESMNVGTQYLRQCENKLFAQTSIQHQLALRGTTANFGTLLCDGDGAYGAFAIIEGQGHCTWRDNSNIGSWSSPDPNPDTQNCNCARDTKIYSDAGKTQPLYCLSNGNYQSYQGTGDETYCVDIDGFRKSNVPVEASKDSDCVQYISYSEHH